MISSSNELNNRSNNYTSMDWSLAVVKISVDGISSIDGDDSLSVREISMGGITSFDGDDLRSVMENKLRW